MSTAARVASPRATFDRIEPAAVALLAERWARRHQVVPIALERGTLVVATRDPGDLDAERAIAFATGRKVRWVAASADEITQLLDRCYGDPVQAREPAPLPVEVQHLAFSTETAGSAQSTDGASVVRLVDQLIADAIAAGASDLHVEPEEQGIAVRHRVDGLLRNVRTLPRALAASLTSRVKILSGLDIADRMRPQDGRARVAVFGAIVDLRVSTLPASHGEKIVIRVLDGSAGVRTLDSIGFADADLHRIRSLLEQREGLVLVTGPTGSGKTTTLYSALREVAQRGVNVVTVEDPIEYRLPGIVQVQVHERAGLTFGAALRSIMRQDPDVILVGEIRDRETAEIAIQASLTGHLVLSTLHTNDAASAVTRLIDIGVPGYQIATAVKGVIAQRLLRRHCADCRGKGCTSCSETGYRGRLAVAEILVSTPEFARRVSTGASTDSLADAARAGGCVSLWDSGMTLVRKGDTSLEELRRIAQPPAESPVHVPAHAPAHSNGSGRPAAVRETPAHQDDVSGVIESITAAHVNNRQAHVADAAASLTHDSAARDEARAQPAPLATIITPPASSLPQPTGNHAVRILWLREPEASHQHATNGRIFPSLPPARLREVTHACASLGERVRVEELLWSDAEAEIGLPPCSAIVGTVARASHLRARIQASPGRPPLLVALAGTRAASDDVSTLARWADLVLPRDEPGRLILASILALLRWRGSGE